MLAFLLPLILERQQAKILCQLIPCGLTSITLISRIKPVNTNSLLYRYYPLLLSG